MIASDPYLQRFVNEFTETNNGKAFFASLDGLGAFIFKDFESGKRKTVYTKINVEICKCGNVKIPHVTFEAISYTGTNNCKSKSNQTSYIKHQTSDIRHTMDIKKITTLRPIEEKWLPVKDQ